MKVDINISPLGAGSVTGAGEYEAGTQVTLQSTPTKAAYPLAYYLINGVKQTQDPYTFTIAEDTAVSAVFSYLFESWMQSMIQIELSEEALCSIMINRNVPLNAMVNEVTERDRWLCLADCCVILLTNWSEYEEKMQGWSSRRKLDYNNELKDLANGLYDKWKDDTRIGRKARIRKWL